MLKFINKREVTVENYKSLTEIQLQQMAMCAALKFGEQYNTPEQFLELTGNGNINEGYTQLFDVVDFKNPQKLVYECWLYTFDNADAFITSSLTHANAVMRKAGTFVPLTNDEVSKNASNNLQMAYHGRDVKSHQKAKKIECEHLRPLEIYLKNLGIAETLRGSTWSNCREWVYFDCILNASQLKSKLKLGDTVKVHDYQDPMVGSEYGLICEQCQDGIIGSHPKSLHAKGLHKIS